MADDGWTTVGALPTGAVFRGRDGLLWQADELARWPHPRRWCFPVGRVGDDELMTGTVEAYPLDFPALLKELAELRTLTHDLLIDRDVAYGREVGRGEALAAAEKWWEDVQDVDREVGRLFDAIRGPTPVRPLPPPERLAARCRALEDALRACVEHCGRYVEREPHEAHFDSYDVDRDAAGHSVERARKLLEEISAEK
jgi:hypothetical protein